MSDLVRARYCIAAALLLLVVGLGPIPSSPHAAGHVDSVTPPQREIWPSTATELAVASIDELVERDQVLRRELHMEASESYIRQLYEQEDRARPRYLNVLFTEEEETEARERQDLWRDNEVLLDYVERRGLREEFGGSFIDHHSGGEFVALFKSRVEHHRAALTHLVPHPQRLSVRQARHSLDDLHDWSSQVERAVAGAAIPQVTSIGVSEATNEVLVAVGRQGQRDQVRDRLRDVLSPVVLAAVKWETVPASRSEMHGGGTRLYAGEGLGRSTDPNSHYCTAHFAVLRVGALNVNGYILSAGHCWQNGQGIYHDGRKIGTVVARRDSGPVDGALIELPSVSSTDGIVVDGPATMRVHGSEEFASPTELTNGYRCITYGQSSTVCGILDAVVSWANNTSVRRVRAAGSFARPGDSGSPAWCPVVPTGIIASGVFIDASGGFAYYTHIAQTELHFSSFVRVS